MKYFFIVGEKSGDQHASKVIYELFQLDANATIFGWGGDHMAQRGAKVLRHFSEYSTMGFTALIRNTWKYFALLKECKNQIVQENPDVIVLVDFAGFNLRIASFAKNLGIKVVYYIPPKVWAWGRSRIRKIKKNCDQILVILPFEETFYKDNFIDSTYVGNPSIEDIKNHSFNENLAPKNQKTKVIALLPGSRDHEIKYSLEIFEKLVTVHKDCEFLIAGVENAHPDLYISIGKYENVTLLFNRQYDILKASDVALVNSGTATLEAAILKTPQIVVYKTSKVNYWLAKLLVRIPYISLVNLIANREVVKELIQSDFNSKNLSEEFNKILTDSETKKRISEGYSEILKVLGDRKASFNVASNIVSLISQN